MVDFRKITEDIKSRWDELNPNAKRKVVAFTVFAVLVLLMFSLAYQKKEKNQNTAPPKKEVHLEEIDTDLLKKTQYYETMKLYEELRKSNEALKKKLASLEEEWKKEKEEKEKKEMEEKKERKEYKIGREKPSVSFPPPPPPSSSSPLMVNTSEKRKTYSSKEEEQILGGIEVVTEKLPKKSKTAKASDKSEIKKKYYLPPSFMQATLLSGLDAPAVSKGKNNPVPVLLRIKAPAVLPNKVRANLKGCFIIAEGVGNLATERADLRLVSLSCIDYKGRAVIDQKVKGFVVDTDGKIGLRGKVVSKMGAAIARALLAGFISGVGNAFSMQAQSVTVTPSGTLTTIKPNQILLYGAGTGIQQAANEVVKFYMELAKQTVPVVEVLPTRTVTVVISEGVELEVKQYDF